MKPVIICVACGVKINASLGEAQPKPGCVSVCANCGLISLFKNNHELRCMTEEEFQNLPKNVVKYILDLSSKFRNHNINVN